MFFKFCEDRVTTISSAAATALAPILLKFHNDPQQMRAIIKIVKNNFRFGDVATFKRRQLFVIMCEHVMNQAPEIFQEHFIHDFLSLVSDKVPNVRISVARTLRNHFKTINGAFVSDPLVVQAIRVLKHDKDPEVRNFAIEIQNLHDFDDTSSTYSGTSGNTDYTEAFNETLNKSQRNSTSTDGETTQMEEEIIKASGINILRAAEKQAEKMAKMKPEVVKLGSLSNVEKREKEQKGEAEELSQKLSELSEEEQKALSEQIDGDDPFGGLDKAETIKEEDMVEYNVGAAEDEEDK